MEDKMAGERLNPVSHQEKPTRASLRAKRQREAQSGRGFPRQRPQAEVTEPVAEETSNRRPYLRELGRRFPVIASVLLSSFLVACGARERDLSTADPPVDKDPSTIFSPGEEIPSPVPRPTPDDLERFISFIPQQQERQAVVTFQEEAKPTATPTTAEIQPVIWSRESKYEGEMALWAIRGKPDFKSGNLSWDVFGYGPVGGNPPPGLIRATAFSLDGEMIGESVREYQRNITWDESQGLAVNLESYRVKEGDTLSSILLNIEGITTDNLENWTARVIRINNLSTQDQLPVRSSLWVPEIVPLTFGDFEEFLKNHTILPGETPDLMARRYGISVENLLAVNGIKGLEEYWKPGLKLVIPDVETCRLDYIRPDRLADELFDPSQVSINPLEYMGEHYPDLASSIHERAKLVHLFVKLGAPPFSSYSVVVRDYKIFENHREELDSSLENIEKTLARYTLTYELNPVIYESLSELKPGIVALNKFLESSPYWDGPPIPRELAGRNIFIEGSGEGLSYGPVGFPELYYNWEEVLGDSKANKDLIKHFLMNVIPHELIHSWVESERGSSSPLPKSWDNFQHATLDLGTGVFLEENGYGSAVDSRIVLIHSRLQGQGIDVFGLLRDIMVAGEGKPGLIEEVVNLYEQNRKPTDPPFEEMFIDSPYFYEMPAGVIDDLDFYMRYAEQY